MHPTRTILLWGLGALFLLRVLGQALVAFRGVPFLPPMAEWQSGVLPYSWLLAAQLLILTLQAKINLDVTRGRGVFSRPRPAAGRVLRSFAYFYAGAMGVRYVATMVLHPERRWLGGTIPIVFHWVLAAYLTVLGVFHVSH